MSYVDRFMAFLLQFCIIATVWSVLWYNNISITDTLVRIRTDIVQTIAPPPPTVVPAFCLGEIRPAWGVDHISTTLGYNYMPIVKRYIRTVDSYNISHVCAQTWSHLHTDGVHEAIETYVRIVLDDAWVYVGPSLEFAEKVNHGHYGARFPPLDLRRPEQFQGMIRDRLERTVEWWLEPEVQQLSRDLLRHPVIAWTDNERFCAWRVEMEKELAGYVDGKTRPSPINSTFSPAALVIFKPHHPAYLDFSHFITAPNHGREMNQTRENQAAEELKSLSAALASIVEIYRKSIDEKTDPSHLEGPPIGELYKTLQTAETKYFRLFAETLARDMSTMPQRKWRDDWATYCRVFPSLVSKNRYSVPING